MVLPTNSNALSKAFLNMFHCTTKAQFIYLCMLNIFLAWYYYTIYKMSDT
jgi:hypothetical protein